MNDAFPHGWKDPTFLCLTRPRLKAGIEWSLYIPLLTMGALLMVFGIIHWDYYAIIGSLVCFGPFKLLLRWAAKEDPQWLTIYFDARKEPLIRPPG